MTSTQFFKVNIITRRVRTFLHPLPKTECEYLDVEAEDIVDAVAKAMEPYKGNFDVMAMARVLHRGADGSVTVMVGEDNMGVVDYERMLVEFGEMLVKINDNPASTFAYEKDDFVA